MLATEIPMSLPSRLSLAALVLLFAAAELAAQSQSVEISTKGVPSSAQTYKSTYDQSQTAYDPVTKVAFLPYMEDPDPASATEPYQNYMVLFDMEKREIIDRHYYIGSAKIADPHNAAWIHVDTDGYVHVMYGCHNSTVYYIRSNLPHDRTLAGGFTAERSLWGRCTYPRIFSDPANAQNLVVIYRGHPNPNPTTNPHKYLTAARSTNGGQTWTQHPFADYSGAGASPMVYASGKMGPDGTLHVAWSWRPTTTGGNIQNGVAYAKSTDFGLTWKRSNLADYTLPISHTTAELIESNLNHVVMWNWPIDQNGHPVIFHWYKQNSFWFTRWNGTAWVKKNIIASSFQDKADYLQASMSNDGSMEIIGQKVINAAADPDVLEIFRIRSPDNGPTWDTTMRSLARDPAVPQVVNYAYPIMVYDGRVGHNVYLYSTYQKKIILIDELAGYSPGESLLVNGSFEATPFDTGWVNSGAVVSAGLVAGSTQSAYLPTPEARIFDAPITGQRNFALDVHFAISSATARSFQLRLFPNSSATGTEIVSLKYENGALQAYDTAWQTLFAAPLLASTDADASGSLGDHPGDVRHVYRLRLTARRFGSSAARYDVSLMTENGGHLGTARDLTIWRTSAVLFAASAIEFNTLNGGAPCWIDQVSQTYTALPASLFEDWVAAHGLDPATSGAPAADPDGDGLENAAEHAFGQHPLDFASEPPFTIGEEFSSDGTFRYTRRDPALTGLSYIVETSINLVQWTPDPSATQTVQATSAGIQTVEVILSPALLTNPALFARVRAQ
jgi:hypothetical protein